MIGPKGLAEEIRICDQQVVHIDRKDSGVHRRIGSQNTVGILTGLRLATSRLPQQHGLEQLHPPRLMFPIRLNKF
jgi:hypothetical protein